MRRKNGQPTKSTIPRFATIHYFLLKWLFAGAACVALLANSGCVTAAHSSVSSKALGRVYYMDGAGGGGVLVNWGRGVQEGIRAAGLRTDYREFRWQTGFGAVADQQASNGYKRRAARRLAQDVVAYRRNHPTASVNLIALSAGTAIAAYALEELPDGCSVDNVVFLASSMSADFEFTPALAHVRDHVYVYTSTKDGVLNSLVPLTGTADRRFCGKDIVGLCGVHHPDQLAAEQTRQYDKIVHVPWTPAFDAVGNHGGHLGGVTPGFVCEHIAPTIRPNITVAVAEAGSAAWHTMVSQQIGSWSEHIPRWSDSQ